MLNQIKLSCTYRCISEITLYKRIGLYNDKMCSYTGSNRGPSAHKTNALTN